MVTLYSSETCPRCNILKEKMNEKGIEYSELHDAAAVRKMGFTTFPILVVDDLPPMKMEEANDWIRNQPEKEV